MNVTLGMVNDPYDLGCITRRHFYGYKHGRPGAPPPLHVTSHHEDANWVPLSRPLQAGGEIGPRLNAGGSIVGPAPLGIDPTDPSTWEGRGYNQSAGMCGRFNAVTPGSPFGEGLAWAP